MSSKVRLVNLNLAPFENPVALARKKAKPQEAVSLQGTAMLNSKLL